MKIAIIAADTEGYKSKVKNETASSIKRIIERAGGKVVLQMVLPEDENVLVKIMERIVDKGVADVIFTVGGIGLSFDDCAPRAVERVSEKGLPGIPEALRSFLITKEKKFMLNRLTAGVRQHTILINLPKNPKYAKDSLEYVWSQIVDGIEILKGEIVDYAGF